MTLSKTRCEIGTSAHPHEMRALEFLAQQLPDREPYRLWGLKELVEPGGRRYEIDAIVLGPNALYLVEIKGHPAHVSGDHVDWTLQWKDGRGRTVMENPVSLANLKAKVLGAQLERELRGGPRPFVQALVFLEHPDASVESKNGADDWVVTRRDVIKALTTGAFPDANPRLRTSVVDRPQAERVAAALRKLGLRNSVARRRVAGYLLDDELADGPGWQDTRAHLEAVPDRHARVRSYVVPGDASRERREQLSRAAAREASLLTVLSDHPRILKMLTAEIDGPLGGPCLLFEHHKDEATLEQFLRRTPDLSFQRRAELVAQVAEALAWCHRKQILHRGLDPTSILVRRQEHPDGLEVADPPLSVRLFNFQLAAHVGGASGTHHASDWSTDPTLVYRAPEVLQNIAFATPASDVFSLGAVAWRVFTNRPPGDTLAERAKLLQVGHLSLAAARDDLALAAPPSARASLDELVAMATCADPVQRIDDVNAFLGLFLDAVTRPEAPEEEDPDPLEARVGDVLKGGITVKKFLGSGATARVLRVERGGLRYALKVALDAENGERLRHEADVLERLRGDRIVVLHDRLTVGGRAALLLEDAGESLADLLLREGPQSLDYARRWGEDLLLALERLEEQGVQHRDIKPANLGVLDGESKRRRHLMLFDFSLSGLPVTAVTAGTPAYRDPFIAERGLWDDAADRYAAAVSLHELLTGLRPRWGRGDGPVGPGDELALDAERFDAAVRDRLVAFFRRAMHRDVARRHASAEAMRREWDACFATPVVQLVAAPAVAPAAEPALDLAAVRPDTALEALGLSPRARNALDRSGIVRAAQLLRLPDNLLSSIRGIGRDTAREIQEFSRRLRELPQLAAVEEPEFRPGFRGEDAYLAITEVDEDLRISLEDAGIMGLAALAAAPRSQVERLARPHGTRALKALRAALDAAQEERKRAEEPRTIEAWLDAAMPPKSRSKRSYVRLVWQWMGLDPAVAVDPGDSVALATALDCTRQNVSAALIRARGEWREAAAFAPLTELVGRQLDALGELARLDRLAETVGALLPHDAGAERDPLAARRVEALVTVAVERDDALAIERVSGRRWVARDQRTFATLKALGAKADEFAARLPLASSGEVQEALASIAAASGLARWPADRLVALAADASRDAARSARLELYPRGLDARRALALCHGALAVERERITEEQLRAALQARYPEAAGLPPRPALDDLVREALGLEWDPGAGAWRRPEARPEASSQVRSNVAPAVLPTVTPSARPAKRSAEAQEAWDFDEALRVAARRRDWRVLEVDPPYAAQVAARVAERLGTAARSLDAALIAEADALMAERRVSAEAVASADRAGPSGKHWALLRTLMQGAADRVAARWTKEKGPLVLTDLGLAARYELRGLLDAMLQATRADDGPAVFLVLARYGDGAAAIDGGAGAGLAVPTHSPAQCAAVPEAWLKNLHRA
jgi:serine/threonine protein kinase